MSTAPLRAAYRAFLEVAAAVTATDDPITPPGR
jgi:hypothetical protein